MYFHFSYESYNPSFFANTNFMNQILVMNTTKNINGIYDTEPDFSPLQKRPTNLKILLFRLLLLFSMIGIGIGIFFLVRYSVVKNKNETISNSLFNTFNISNLYANRQNYTPVKMSHTATNAFYIIGSIQISKLKLDYPIVSDMSDELLKISPCKFAGPAPNESGNLCIAGHNYDDNRFFSKIKKLKNNDPIVIHDTAGNALTYYVYSVYETSFNDTTCTNQDTNGQKEITLVTCNNTNGNRIIVKAKAI